MDVFENIEGILKEKDIEYEVSEHKPVFTSEEAAEVRGVELKTGVKAMVLETSEGLLMALVPADKRVDMDRIKKLEKTDWVSLAKPGKVFAVTGCKVGSVPPFGYKNRLKTYFDEGILENEKINFNAGKHEVSIHMGAEDLKEAVEPDFVGEISE